MPWVSLPGGVSGVSCALICEPFGTRLLYATLCWIPAQGSFMIGGTMRKYFFVLLSAFSPLVYADQGGLISSAGGSLAAISIANLPGTLAIAPPHLTFTSSDGSTVINATFSASNTVEFCSGGGKGGKVKCSFTFTGSFGGILTANGGTQAINGTTNQVYGSSGIIYGSTGYNSAYTPFYFTDGNAR